MDRTSRAGSAPGGNGGGRTPASPLRRLATGSLALVLAASLYGCSSSAPGSPSASGEPAPGGSGGPETRRAAPATGAAEQAVDAAGRRTGAPEQAADVAAQQSGTAETRGGAPERGGSAAEGRSPSADREQGGTERVRVVPPAKPGQPAVVEGGGTGEERRSTTATVALDKPARPAEGLEITIASAKPVDAQGMGPGGMSGPGIAVVVTVRNATEAPVSTLGSSVTVTYGPQDQPAPPSRQRGEEALPNEVAPGRTVSGTYTFLVPEDARDDVQITASYRATDPAAVFAGSVRGNGADR